MSWRYQPVWVDHGEERVFSLCEVYLDKDGRLEGWTEKPVMEAIGIDDVQDLRGCLAQMLADSYRWKPVAFSSLKVGMTFERYATQEQMEHIAGMIEAMGKAANVDCTRVN